MTYREERAISRLLRRLVLHANIIIVNNINRVYNIYVVYIVYVIDIYIYGLSMLLVLVVVNRFV